MTDELKKRSRVWMLWVLILLNLLAYPLSYGPAFRFALDSRDADTNILTLSGHQHPDAQSSLRADRMAVHAF